MDDLTAITRIKQGNPTGLETLVTRHQLKAVSAAFLILHDRSLAEEVTQAAFVRVMEKIDQFDERRPFAPWFFKIVIHEAIQITRSWGRTINLEDDPDQEVNVLVKYLVDPQPQPENLLEIKQSKELVWAALKRLPPEQRAVAVMRYYLEMSEKDMAAQMDRPVSTVKWWLRAARQRLQTLLRATQYFEGRD